MFCFFLNRFKNFDLSDIFYVVLITSLMVVLSPAAGVFCAIVSHPADSVVSVLNKESGSTAIGVLKKLGPKGEE